MKCPTCGAENEPTNRFCEQCGSRITPSGEFQPASAANLSSAPTAAATTCPSCGSPVLPGEAFCDNCGAALNSVAPVATSSAMNEAPTMLAQPAQSIGSAPSNDQGTICPACGHQNLPGDRFCDNCGAELAQPSSNSAPAVEAPPAVAQSQSQPASQAPAGQAAADANATTAEQPAIPAAAETPASSAASATGPASPASATNSGAGASAQSGYEADKQRLNDEIDRQQKIIEQFEQMQTMFGAATPPAVLQGLSEARDARAKAEADMAALQPPAPPVDPAEVARLNDEIDRQQKIIEQFEQMQTMFGAATPPAVVQGLSDARDARAKAEADLAALTSGAAAPAAAATAPSAPEAASTPPPSVEAPSSTGPSSAPEAAPAASVAATAEAPALEDVPASPASAPPVAPVAPPLPSAGPAIPRLVMDDGKELALPTDKREIIIGREDPISGIFPEVDLTPFGGESGGVSRQHARMNNDNGQWTLTDLNSTNYTRVNGTKIEPNTAVPIASGAKLQFGRVALTFQA